MENFGFETDCTEKSPLLNGGPALGLVKATQQDFSIFWLCR
jgi:hypothetical protein